MQETYEPNAIEARWQKEWTDKEAFKAVLADGRPKYYMLEMFPYPSGRIHMGHVRNYGIGDVVARFRWKQGYKVLHPMGWDAFGLPAENAAIERGIHPAEWTYNNIREMREQLKSLGIAYDWSRELATCHPGYYKWEQMVFTRALAQGLVYRKQALVNWSEKMQTVLANEQVIDGKDYRYGLPVVQKELTQWFYKTTALAEQLLEGLSELSGHWPERVILEQRARIGKSYGAEVRFRLEHKVEEHEEIVVFTTRPDTLWGVTFMSIAAEHPLASRLAIGTPREDEVKAFIAKVQAQDKFKRSADDYVKEGVFTGRYCLNPVTGDKVPVFIANFVLMDYGTGAVMAVPAHDQRDFEFSRKYDLPVKVVIQPKDGPVLDPATMTAAYTEDGMQVSSGPFDGMNNREAIEKISDYLQDKGFGGKTTSYRLRDWCISRQRYWGAPIPVIYCDSCGAVPVPDEQLPVLLPENVVFQAEGGSPLMRCEEFVHTRCPSCGGPGRRETDTMDTFMESSWYHLRYTSPRYELGLVNADEAKEWMPVDQYIGGIEHAVGHLVYSRFYHRLLREIGFVPKEVPAEPFPRLLTQGMVCMETLFTLDDHDQPVWHYPEDVENGLSKVNGQKVQTGRVEKMSKSKRNVVDTSEIIARYGVDSARMFTLFASPPENDLIWKDEGVEGIYRFLSRLWRIVWTRKDDIRGAAPYQGDGSNLPADFAMLRKQHHKTVKGVTEDIEDRFHFNTAISKCMELTNLLVKQSLPSGDAESASVQRDAVFALIGLLTPFAPHICEELFEALGGKGQAALAPWPTFDPAVAADDVVTIAIQVLGKLRATMELPAGATKEEMEKAALENPNVQRHIEGKTLRKVIVVPGKLVNLVVG